MVTGSSCKQFTIIAKMCDILSWQDVPNVCGFIDLSRLGMKHDMQKSFEYNVKISKYINLKLICFWCFIILKKICYPWPGLKSMNLGITVTSISH